MAEQNNITLVLTDINKDIKLSKFVDIFTKHGDIMGAKITKRSVEDKIIHVGFVTFEDAEVARKFMADNDNKIDLLGKKVDVAFAKRGKSRRNDAYSKAGFHRTKLYVSGLPVDYTEKEISDLLGKCQITMPKESKGYCFATYETEKEKNEAVIKLDGKLINEDHNLMLAPAFVGGPRNTERKGNFRGPRREFGGRKNEDERKELL